MPHQHHLLHTGPDQSCFTLSLEESQTDLLSVQVPRDLLKDWSIVQSEGSAAGLELPPGLPPALVQTFTLQARALQSSPTAYEHMAVQQACSQLLSNVRLCQPIHSYIWCLN